MDTLKDKKNYWEFKMELPIDDKELNKLVFITERLKLHKLHNKLRYAQQFRKYGDSWPDSYKEEFNKMYGGVI